MDAKTYRQQSNFPYLSRASDQELLDVALTLLPAHVLEEALQKRARHQDDSAVAHLIDQIDTRSFRQAAALLLGKPTLKTQPIIARDTGRVFRAQGRPPKHVEPIYVDTEAEALQLLSE